MQDIIAKLTAKDDKYACAIADEIIFTSINFKVNKIAARWPAKAVAQFFYFFKNRQ